ncbi:hypothetical protein D9V32_02620 [Mycetocola tolaasinivorans]|uniref:Uncharacterized protein n=1 Tax=Mycetocola tolaasinivorans TaxID=76635 RepID=A0A3L7ABK7_9MICO|nr:hypothetical protein [Mycetocola tolaasinivorans]RLP77364.1 hypothetical protein D9V32_02620 [Mycetocola tolaasinivorans]
MTVLKFGRSEAVAGDATVLSRVCSVAGILGFVTAITLIVFAAYRLDAGGAFWGLGVLALAILVHAVGVVLRLRHGFTLGSARA